MENPKNRPETLAQFKKSAGQNWWLYSSEWACEWISFYCSRLAIFQILEYIGRIITVVSVLVAVTMYFYEAPDRLKQKHYRAWELINSARGSTGDGGRIDALQDLREDQVSLAAAPLSNAFLMRIGPGGEQKGINLKGAVLTAACLNNAFLENADLSDAHLERANLSDARLDGANFSRANLGGANLSGAQGFTSDQLQSAAWVCETILPTSRGEPDNRNCPGGMPALRSQLWKCP